MIAPEFDIVRRLRDAAMDVAREIETGALVPGRIDLFIPLPGVAIAEMPRDSKPHCAMGHVLARAFGSPKMSVDQPVKKFEVGFKRCVSGAFPGLSTKIRDEVLALVNGEFVQNVVNTNDFCMHSDRDLRRLTGVAECLRKFAVHCQQIDIDVLPRVDLRSL